MPILVRCAVAALVLLASAGLADPAVAAPSSAPPSVKHSVKHGRGLAAPTGRSVQAKRFRASSALPDSVDLTPWAVPTGDQGQVNSCTSWSVGYTLTGWWASKLGKPTAFAPMYVYSQTHLTNTPDGGGAYLSDTFGVEQNQGIDTRAHYSHSGYDFSAVPNAGETANAANYRMGAMQRLYAGYMGVATSGGKAAIETALAAGRPVVLGIPIYANFYYLDAADHRFSAADATGSLYGYHAVVVLGYDATGVTIENSWGSAWGDRGFAQLDWDFVGSYSIEADTTAGLVATPPDAGVASWPTTVTTSVSANSATVAWQPPATSGGSAVTGYRVTRDGQDLAGTGARTVDVPPATRSLTFSDLYASSQYTLTVRALTSVGDGEVTNASIRTAAAAVPGAPTGLQVTPSTDGTMIDVAWTAPGQNGGSPISAYRLLVSGGGTSSSWTVSTTSPARRLSAVRPGTDYTLTLSAVNGVGAGPVAATSFQTPDVPGAPSIAGTTSTTTTASVSWAPGSGTPTGYRVRLGNGLPVDLTAGTRSYSFTGLNAGSSFPVTVAALNGVGASPPVTVTIRTASAPAGVVPTSPGPASTSGLQGTTVGPDTSVPAGGSTSTSTGTSTTTSSTPSNPTSTTAPSVPSRPAAVSARAQGTTVVVRWTAPENDGGSAITGWRVTVGSAVVVVTDRFARSAVVRGVEAGATSRVTVVAENSSGLGDAAVTSALVPRPLTAPTKVSAVRSAHAIVLRWQPPASSGGNLVTAYRVSRSGLDAHGHRFGTKTLRAGVHSFRFPGLAGHHGYTITIRAVASTGQGPAVTARARTS